jgi:hypothetical protein
VYVSVAVLVCGVALSACSSSTKGHGKASASVSTPQTVTVTETPTSTPVDSESVPTDVVSGGSVPSVSGIVPPGRANTPLTLNDFFNPDGNWEQAVVNVADQSGVQAIRGDLGSCGDDAELELRLNDRFRTLKFDVGEDNTSPSSDQTLVVTVSVNGQQVNAKKVGFNTILPLSVNVTSANSVKIDFENDPNGSCGNEERVYPLLFNAVVS